MGAEGQVDRVVLLAQVFQGEILADRYIKERLDARR